MIVYRVQTYPGADEWANEWCPTRAEGKTLLDECTGAEVPARLDAVAVEAGREGLCKFLNAAEANHMNQDPSALIARNF